MSLLIREGPPIPGRQVGRQLDRQADRWGDKQIERQVGRQVGRQTGRHVGRQAGWTGRHHLTAGSLSLQSCNQCSVCVCVCVCLCVLPCYSTHSCRNTHLLLVDEVQSILCSAVAS